MSPSPSRLASAAPLYRDHATGTEPRPLWRHLKAKIEAAALVTITIVEFKDDDEDFPPGWYARADRDVGGPSIRSEGVASAWADGPFLVLDRLAAKLGVVTDTDDVGVAA